MGLVVCYAFSLPYAFLCANHLQPFLQHTRFDIAAIFEILSEACRLRVNFPSSQAVLRRGLKVLIRIFATINKTHTRDSSTMAKAQSVLQNTWIFSITTTNACPIRVVRSHYTRYWTIMQWQLSEENSNGKTVVKMNKWTADSCHCLLYTVAEITNFSPISCL